MSFLQEKVQILEISLGLVFWKNKIRKMKMQGFWFKFNILIQLFNYTVLVTGTQIHLFNIVTIKEINCSSHITSLCFMTY